MSSSSSINPRTGFCSETRTFHSLRPPAPLPSAAQPLTVASYAFSLLPQPLPSNPAFIDSATGASLSFSHFFNQIQSLAFSLLSKFSLSNGDIAFILAPTSLQIPILYFALFSLGVVVSPSNPLGSASEISHQLSLSKPIIAFATSSVASKLPSTLKTIIIDSDGFTSMTAEAARKVLPPDPFKISQTDPAAILYSSGTTGRVKGVALSHGNFIALTASYVSIEGNFDTRLVSLLTVPLFHVFGAFMMIKNVAIGHTTVLMERFDFVKMLQAVERFKVNDIPVSPPLVLALAKSEIVKKYDLSSLEGLGCGGAPLGKEVTEKFKERFPNVEIFQVRLQSYWLFI